MVNQSISNFWLNMELMLITKVKMILLLFIGLVINFFISNDLHFIFLIASGGFATSVKKLIALKADVNAVSGSGATPVHLAALSGNLNSVEKLIEKNVDPLQVDSLGRTALHFAVSSGQARCISYLLQIKPAAMRIKDRQGNTPLDLARKTKNQEAIKILSVIIFFFLFFNFIFFFLKIRKDHWFLNIKQFLKLS